VKFQDRSLGTHDFEQAEVEKKCVDSKLVFNAVEFAITC
jgi:hypothetical protein